ncbi:MAG: oligosaccharide flippase family protein [Phycisphaerae bacterium]
MGANILFTFASVPLALHYLSKSEFGLWALTAQLAGYVALIDLGMSGSIARILIDYKDEKEGTNYGKVLLTGALVNLVQGLLIFIFGSVLAFFLQDILNIESTLRRDFLLLSIGQCALLGGGFAVQIFGITLIANQRYDVGNYSHAVCFFVNFGVMWFCFAQGVGVYGLLWGQAAQQGIAIVIATAGCIRLGMLPARHRWGRPTWQLFCEVFSLGRDIFMFALGSQLVNASQTILITRILGLEACAVWSICIRPFSMLLQFLGRINDFTYAGFAEILVQNDHGRLLRRFKSLAVLSASLAVISGGMLVLCNQSFLFLWTKGKVSWPLLNDGLLAVWLVTITLGRIHTGFITVTKDFRVIRYLYFVEGIAFIGASLFLLPYGGMTAMLAVSIASSMVFTLQYALRRTAGYFEIRLVEPSFRWLLPAAKCGTAMIPAITILWFATTSCGPLVLFLLRATIGSVAAGLILWHWGLEAELKVEIVERIKRKYGNLNG